MKILGLNAGSSTQKSCLYEIDNKGLPEQPGKPLWEAKIDWTGKSGVAVLKVETAAGVSLTEQLPVEERQQAIAHMLDTLWRGET